MPCYSPMTAYRSKEGRGLNGSWPLVFNPVDGYVDMAVSIPCGHCIGCRLEYSRQWAIRCVNESQMHEANSFITLTYDDAHIGNNVLNKRDIKLFIKKIRKKHKIRYYQCGEYGEKNGRRHHHVLVFGYSWPDKTIWKEREGIKLYMSSELSSQWPHGLHVIGELTWDSAAYTARYVLKKIGEGAAPDGQRSEAAAGPVVEKQREYCTMSRKPGIGSEWWSKWKKDVLAIDGMITKKGLTCKPSRYYDKVYDMENHSQMEKIKIERRREAIIKSWEQLRVEEENKKSQILLLQRRIEL